MSGGERGRPMSKDSKKKKDRKKAVLERPTPKFLKEMKVK